MRLVADRLTSGLALMAAGFFGGQYYYKQQQFEHMAQDAGVKVPPTPLLNVMTRHGFTQSGQIGILTFLHIYDIAVPNKFADESMAHDWLKTSTQKFLRKGERWSPENQALEKKLQEQHQRMIGATHQLDLIAEEKPDPNKFKDCVVILPGALDTRVKQRITDLEEAETKGFSITGVVVATGFRQLLGRECPDLNDRQEPAMIQHLWNQRCAVNPSLANLPFNLSIAPLKPGQKRSTTVDTAQALTNSAMLSTNNILVVIEKPYTGRFLSIIAEHLPNHNVSCYARGLDPDKMSLFTGSDEVARRIYFQFPQVQACIHAEQCRDEQFDSLSTNFDPF